MLGRAIDVYRPVLVFTASMLGVLALSRMLLIAMCWSRVEAVDGALYVLVQGVRFDLILVCALVLIPALLSPFLCGRMAWRKLETVYLIGAFTLAVFMEVATPTFISEYDLRPNILFVEYLKYPKEVGMMLLGGYKTDIVVGLAVLALVSFVFVKFILGRARVVPNMRPAQALLCSVVVLSLCVLGVRSSIGHRPANPSVVAFSADLLVNDLTLSSLYSTAYAIYSSIRHESSVRAYGRMKLDEAIAEVRVEMAVPLADFTSPELPTLHRSHWVKPKAEPLNLVIILQESLGAEFVGALGGVGVTPELDALTKQGIWFENLYATGTRSVRGIEAVVSGFTPTPARSVVKLPKSQTGFFTIASLLRKHGYDTSFIYGGEAHFDNMRQFFVGNGFDHIVEQKDFANPVFVGSWGASDEDLFNKAHERFSEAGNKPFFSLVFTSSNHSPFEFPEGRIELHEEPRDTVNNAVKYADAAMGDFFRTARESDYWDNTLFLVVADHNSRVRGANLVPIEYFHIPGLLLGGQVKPRIVSRLASQIDLLPTLLSMLGIVDDHPATGYDLFRPDVDTIPGRAMMQYNSTQAYMRGDEVVVMEMDKPATMYRRTSAGLVESAVQDPELIRRAVAYSVWSASAYQGRLYRLPVEADSD